MAKVTKEKDLLKELRALIKDIPEDGLLFLIKQAQTILYNMKVDELNSVQERMDNSKSSVPSDTSDTTQVAIERSSFGRSFILVIGSCRKVLSETEITKIVRIAWNASNSADGAARLFAWFNKNRDDIILDAELHPKHRALRELYTYLKKNFSLV